jgi:glycosyltransferase involved in cell wall biosynthesis
MNIRPWAAKVGGSRRPWHGDSRIEVRVITAGMRQLPRQSTDDGVLVLRPRSFRRQMHTCSFREMGQYVVCCFLETLRQCSRWKPDIIHAHFAVPSGLLALLANGFERIPYVLTAHLGDVPGGVPERTGWLLRTIHPLAQSIWKQAAATTAVSSFVADLARQAYGANPVCITNGIELTDAPPAPDAAGWPPTMIFAGRFLPQKNLPFLIRALARLKHRKWRLELIGDGPDRPAMERLIRRFEIRDRVIFHGWKPPAEADALLAASDILVVPSRSEGMPLIGLQALKYGLALAVSDIPGNRELIEPGENGLSAPPDDEAEFAAMLAHILRDPHNLLRMRMASHRMAARFDANLQIDKYEAVLSQASAARETESLASKGGK